MCRAAVEFLCRTAGENTASVMRIWISIISQSLELYSDYEILIRRYAISTAKKGAGEVSGSYRTPRGRHLIRAKIGAGALDNAVFVGRRATGEVWTPELGDANPDRDWILTRILWLSGREPGFNRLGDVDTMRRYIYLHGSPDSVEMGTPGSIGCIRMRNRDIVELFDLVPPYTPVDIVEYSIESGTWSDLGGLAGPVREQVFVREQGVPLDMEYDAADPISLHMLARGPAGEAIGTGRLLSDGHVGRLAVLPEWRGKGVGTALLSHVIEAARKRDMSRLALNVQTSAIGFYRRFGFVSDGTEFVEAGIRHVPMVKTLTA
jgi:predicted GNAT family N-acyltransferase